jgi:MoxR-like ATPase
MAFGTLLQVAAARVPAMLVGPAGSGKSTAGRQVAQELGLKFVTESCSPQMSKWDIMGFMGATGNYVPGVIRDAFENGGVVLLDEIDASNPAVLVSVNLIASVSVGETVTFPDGADVPRHEDFILIAGANTFGDGASDEYVGREQLDAATLDRFAAIEWGYDESLEMLAAGEGAEAWVTYVQRVRKAAQAAQVDMMITPRASINGASLLRAGMARTTVESLVIWKGVSADAKCTVRAFL